MHFRISEKIYWEYCIDAYQWSLTLESNFNFQVVQVQVLLVV